MEEKYKENIFIGALMGVFLFSACIVPLFNGVPQTVNAMQHIPQQKAMVSLYTFEKERIGRYQVELSVDDANELCNLLIEWNVATSTTSLMNDTGRLQRQLLSFLHQHWVLPNEVIGDVLHALSLSNTVQGQLGISRLSPSLLPRYEKRVTVFRAGITSTGSGILIPMALSPRPRISTIWSATSGKTFAVNWVTKYGYNATGPHLGVALGFIGVGFSSRIPNASRYVLIGGALMALLFGDTITEVVPSEVRTAQGEGR